ncbi:MAG: hypothetical protein V8S92_02595 [Oscillospiraceae bacterium]
MCHHHRDHWDNATIDDVRAELNDNGLVEYPWLFQFYCWFSHAEDQISPARTS